MTDLATAPNFRDLGGPAGAGGRRVRCGRVFRSEMILEPTDTDAIELAAHGITLVCDLRSETERTHSPNRWWAQRGVACNAFDILAGFAQGEGPWAVLRRDPGRAGGLEAMRTVYAGMPAAAAPHFAPMIERMLATPGAVLIHCAAGKDRTGFVSAVLLAALGVSREAILEDYLASRGRRTAQVAEATRRLVQAAVGEVSPEALEALLDVDARYLDASFAAIEARHGDVLGYLAAAGVGADCIDALQARLLG